MKKATDKTIDRIVEAARKVNEAKWKLADMLEEAKQASNWKEICEARGLCHNADAADWTC